MQAPNWTDFLSCSICTNKFNPTDICPISLSCGHTLCTRCLGKLKTRSCPYDKMGISPGAETLPPNVALLQLLGHQVDLPMDNSHVQQLSVEERDRYEASLHAMAELALILKPLAEHGTTAAMGHLTKPMLKKLVTVVNCQVLEGDGRVRGLRAARSIADRTVTELLVLHQNQQQISTLLWTAVRNRGCQFLGPVMQEEALKLILRVLESGNSLSRKNIVLFVVQRLSVDFPQASKTSIGHVVQLLYRASCFNVEKRDDDSSLMQLKEEFRVYESLRREHDSQIIRMALEAGLRISPEQWSTLLYGDHKHKSDMQSIIDKLTAQGAVSSGLSELIVAIGRSQDPYQLSEKVLPHLETILKLQVDKESSVVGWDVFCLGMKSLLATLQGFCAYMQIQSGRFKTGMCPYLTKPGGCPKGENCTYAHSEEERDRFRNMVRPSTKPMKPRSGDQFPKNGSLNRSGTSGTRNSRFSGEIGITANVDGTTPLSSLSSLGGGVVQSVGSGDSDSPDVSFQGHYHSGGLDTGMYRLGRHSGPITAPVLSNQDWNVVTGSRGVATANQSYSGPVENAYLPVATPRPVGREVGVDYHSGAPMGPSLSYPVNPTPQLLELDLLKLQHEALRQSVEVSKFPVYKDLGYKSEAGSQQEWLSPESPSTYAAVHSQMPSQPLVQSHLGSAGEAVHSMVQPTQDHTYSSTEQLLLTSMQSLCISQTNQDYQGTSGTAGAFSTDITQTLPTVTPATVVATPTIQSVDIVASLPESTTSGDGTGIDGAVGVTYHNSHATPARTSVTSSIGGAGDVSATSVGGASRGQEVLEEEIRRLREQLRESSQTIQKQQAQLQHVSRPPTNPQPGARYSQQALHQQHPYPGTSLSQPMGLPVPSLVESLAAPPPQVQSFNNQSSAAILSQYTPQQLQAALTLLMGSRGGVAGMGPSLTQTATPNYYGTPSPYPTPRQWVNSQATPPSQVYSGPHSLPVGSNITPPGTAYIMSLPGNTTMPQPQALVGGASRLHAPEHPDDGMLAAYIQMMEQSKAASTAPNLHPPQPHSHSSVYPAPQGHYYQQ